ncbi:universal stress protein [Sphingobacterium deserti]|uniref:UspA domain-containing protein n=1 Tax=Sphingobacterium deserti TaxID=1229276 RepID=A0A0B8T265_9SPHI|nr:universal stress protein [Sphingobacterium deserti]KGE12883.1 UspA domain-containing protein [Sphingobacterium deserti]
MRILFPTDFSDAANNAFVYALHLAKDLKATIYVLHTYMQPVLTATHGGQPEIVPEVYENYEFHQFESYKRHTELLRSIALEKDLAQIPLTFLFEEGTVVANAEEIIEREKINFVLMGTNRAQGLIDKIFGSNTLGVIRGVRVPVLSVPKESNYKRIEEVIFTTLFRDNDEAALQEIFDIIRPFGVRVKCVYVHKEYNAEVIGISERWRKKFQEEKLEFVFLEYKESIEHTVNVYINQYGADLLCVVKRNRNFLERIFTSSISNRLRVHANMATLVLQEGDDPGNF